MSYLFRWAITFAAFIVIDLIWLGIVAQPLYDHFIGEFLRESPNWYSALAFYSLFVAGVLYFAVDPALRQKSRRYAFKNGALFGFFTYMTYELTNHAVLEGWPFGIVLIDIAWGTVLGGATAVLAYSLLTAQWASRPAKK